MAILAYLAKLTDGWNSPTKFPPNRLRNGDFIAHLDKQTDQPPTRHRKNNCNYSFLKSVQMGTEMVIWAILTNQRTNHLLWKKNNLLGPFGTSTQISTNSIRNFSPFPQIIWPTDRLTNRPTTYYRLFETSIPIFSQIGSEMAIFITN